MLLLPLPMPSTMLRKPATMLPMPLTIVSDAFDDAADAASWSRCALRVADGGQTRWMEGPKG